MLSWDESVFSNEHVFEIDYVPETFKHREGQTQSLTYALRPRCGVATAERRRSGTARDGKDDGDPEAVRRGGSPDERGPNDPSQLSGQRDSVLGVFAALRGHVRLRTALLGDLLQEAVRPDRRETCRGGQGARRRPGRHQLPLYENEASDTLYSLLRAHEEYPGAKIGVVVVSSDPALDVIDELDSRVQSVFRPEDVYFPVYDQPEIVDILEERVERGFNDGVIARDTLEYVAELTAESGDLRVGIDLLRRAGLNAEMRASRTVERQDVENAYEKSKYINLSRSLSGLTDTERALLEVIADRDGDQAGEVYEVFHDRTDLGYTRYPKS